MIMKEWWHLVMVNNGIERIWCY